ncbi:MAG: phosphate ABC transporter permease subunit PstC [Candidatus Meridianibacter frigidus]|nr:MAG: phosphate ABC transporter permease subunit PstC [Candidatus Eremiobacteraeota bacterium]
MVGPVIATHSSRAHVQESIARGVLLAASAFVILAMAAIVVYLASEGLRLFFVDHISPLAFLGSAAFEPDSRSPGALAFIVGSLAVTFFAIVMGGPLGIAVGIFLSQLAPPRLGSIMKPAIEILVGIPSVVYGWLGLTLLAPLIRLHLGSQTGFGLLTAGIVLSIMILPTVISLSEDALKSVPVTIKEASMALGATRWQTIFHVLLPAARSGLTVALILGIARAIGEALAVQMVIGNSAVIPQGLLNPAATLTTEIVTDMGSAQQGSVLQHSLFSMAFLLLLIAMALITLVRWALKRSAL